MFDGVLELADVAGPLVRRSDRRARRVKTRRSCAAPCLRVGGRTSSRAAECLRGALERRQRKRHDFQPVEQIAAEGAVGDRLLEVAIGRRDQPKVDAHGPCAADAFELTILEHAQQLGLEFERQLADLVEKDGSTVGGFELASLLGDSAGKGAPFVPEQLALEQG